MSRTDEQRSQDIRDAMLIDLAHAISHILQRHGPDSKGYNLAGRLEGHAEILQSDRNSR